MKKRHVIPALIVCLFATSVAIARDAWPTRDWTMTTPPEVGLDARVLTAFDADISEGKYGYVDSLLVIRHGKIAFERYYGHDYADIYREEARTPGPLVVGDLTGPYNYFNAWWHPYYQDSDLHTMQSVTKSVTSVIVGIAVSRGEFPDLDTPVLDFFEPGAVANVDERKKRMTIRHLLTMTAGLDWNENLAYTDPDNSWSDLQQARDWVRFTMDRPMATAPGDAFRYNSGATLILGHVFNKAIGRDLETYAVKHLFEPLGIEYFWKRTPSGLVDTQEGLYVSTRDMAKIMYLLSTGGRWEDQQILSEDWVRDSTAPFIAITDDGSGEYGYKWWLSNFEYDGERRVAIAGSGYGGQTPVLLPDYDLVIVVTGWNTLPDQPYLSMREAVGRVLAAVQD